MLDSRRPARYTTCVCVLVPQGLIVFYLSETVKEQALIEGYAL